MMAENDTHTHTHIPITTTLTLPLSELQFRYTTGGGPGGQHVNRSATRVTLLFDVANSPSLDDDTRARLQDRLASRLDSRGVLQITVHESRSQYRNRSIALQRFQAVMSEAMQEQPPRTPTRPSRAIRERRRIRKSQQSATKRDRRRDWSET